MELKITPYIGDKPLEISADTQQKIVPTPSYSKHVAVVIKRTGLLTVIGENNEEKVSSAIGELKALVTQIDTERKAAKAPFLTIGRGIDNAAESLTEPITREITRLTKLVRSYADAKESERQEQIRRAEAEKQKRIQDEIQERNRLEAEKQALLAKMRNAEGLEEAGAYRNLVKEQESAIADQEVSINFAISKDPEIPVFTEPLVKGSSFRIEPKVSITLEGIKTMLQVPDGWELFRRFVKAELRVLEAKSEVRRQLEDHPDNPHFMPSIPGVTIELVRTPVHRSSAPVSL